MQTSIFPSAIYRCNYIFRIKEDNHHRGKKKCKTKRKKTKQNNNKLNSKEKRTNAILHGDESISDIFCSSAVNVTKQKCKKRKQQKTKAEIYIQGIDTIFRTYFKKKKRKKFEWATMASNKARGKHFGRRNKNTKVRKKNETKRISLFSHSFTVSYIAVIVTELDKSTRNREKKWKNITVSTCGCASTSCICNLSFVASLHNRTKWNETNRTEENIFGICFCHTFDKW